MFRNHNRFLCDPDKCPCAEPWGPSDRWLRCRTETVCRAPSVEKISNLMQRDERTEHVTSAGDNKRGFNYMTRCIRMDKHLSAAFPIRNCMKQRNASSPLHFTLL